MANNMKFELLADSIKEINVKAVNVAKSAVNQLMTFRNWAIGYYIVEYVYITVRMSPCSGGTETASPVAGNLWCHPKSRMTAAAK